MVKLEGFKAVGIKNVGLHQFGSLIPESALELYKQLEQIPTRIKPERHYGLAPCSPAQDQPESHTYYIAVEVSSFEGVPEHLEKITVPSQTCIKISKGLDRMVGDVFKEAAELSQDPSIQKRIHQNAFQVSIFHESLENYNDRLRGEAKDRFSMDLFEPVILRSSFITK